MSRLRDEGCVFAYSKGDGVSYSLPRDQYEPLKAAWMAGKAFYEGTTFYGSALVLKLGDIVAISDATPVTLAAGRMDRASDEREDALNV